MHTSNILPKRYFIRLCLFNTLHVREYGVVCVLCTYITYNIDAVALLVLFVCQRFRHLAKAAAQDEYTVIYDRILVFYVVDCECARIKHTHTTSQRLPTHPTHNNTFLKQASKQAIYRIAHTALFTYLFRKNSTQSIFGMAQLLFKLYKTTVIEEKK